MRAARDNPDERRTHALIATLAFHALLAAGLYAAGELVDRDRTRPETIEIEIVEPPPPPPRVEEPEPPPPPQVEEPEPPPPKPAVKPPPRVEKPAPPPPAKEPPPPANTEPAPDPAPGPPSPEPPAPVVTLPDIAPGGTGPPAAVGKPTTRRVSRGGTGTGTGGGATEGTGTGGARPVSVAAIKRRARPINPDLDTSKLYPAEARRLGIEGQIKVALIVDETGRVASKKLVTRLGHGLDELALTLADKLTFEPAVDTEDRPVADRVVWTFTFVLPR